MSDRVCQFCKSKFDRVVPLPSVMPPEQFPDDGHIYKAHNHTALVFRCGTVERVEGGGIIRRSRDCMELSEMSMRREMFELNEQIADAWNECEMLRSELLNSRGETVFELCNEIIKLKKQVRKLTRNHVPMPRSHAANAGACEAWERLTRAELSVQRLIQAGNDVAEYNSGSAYVRHWRKVVEEVKP